ncbi:MAG: PKD domain-containing protein [Planctomycetota bacterium]
MKRIWKIEALWFPIILLALLGGCAQEEAPPPAPPSADFVADVTYGGPPLTVQFQDRTTTTTTLTSWSWDFGNGESASEKDPTHTFDSVGVYTVTLTVTAVSGSDTCTKPGYIIVTNPAQTAVFMGSPLTGPAPLQVQFTDLSSVTGTISAWSWTFGDGGTSTQQDPLYTYLAVGTYTVTLTITTSSGNATETKMSYITVTTPTGGGGGGGGGGTTPAGVDPSNGSGGTITAGNSGFTPLGAEIYVPTSYTPTTFASPVVWLFNEQLSDWQAIADAEKIILCDLHEYNNTTNIVNKLNESIPILENQYNVDKARYYWAGWSAGGNLVVIIGSQNQNLIAGTMVFPGTGGNYAQPSMQSWTGHKIRMYYACGDQDPNYAWTAVQYEANSWNQWYGYTTRFDKIAGSGHYISESTYGVRATAWNWIKGYNLQN